MRKPVYVDYVRAGGLRAVALLYEIVNRKPNMCGLGGSVSLEMNQKITIRELLFLQKNKTFKPAYHRHLAVRFDLFVDSFGRSLSVKNNHKK